MATNPITRPEGPARTTPSSDQAQSIHEIQAVCAKHAVSCGQPDSLAQFMQALQGDKHFAMDFWSVIARISDHGHSSDPDWLLNVVVEAVTDQSPADLRTSGPAQQLQVNKLAGMLAGEDEAAPPLRPAQSAQPLGRASDDGLSDPSFRAGPPTPASVPISSTDRADRPRLVLRPETPMAAAMDRNLHDRDPYNLDPSPRRRRDRTPNRARLEPEPSFAIPLAAYADESSDSPAVSRKLVGAIVVIVLLAAGLFYLRHSNSSEWQRLDAAARSQYASAAALFQHHSAASPAASVNPDQAPPTNPSSFTLSPSAGAAGPQPAAAPANPPSPAPATAAQTPEPATPQTDRPSTPEPVAAAGPALRSASGDTTSQPETQPHAEASVAIPAAEMRNYLISSRIPIYPQGAHGTVVIQAVVTARGTVEPMRVVSGNPELREAAMAAVATWHYRPYMLNGTPVDVSTTISVNDTGND